nr:hypothetical protein Iba_chr05dCG8940 [Ipomoea batatas]
MDGSYVAQLVYEIGPGEGLNTGPGGSIAFDDVAWAAYNVHGSGVYTACMAVVYGCMVAAYDVHGSGVYTACMAVVYGCMAATYRCMVVVCVRRANRTYPRSVESVFVEDGEPIQIDAILLCEVDRVKKWWISNLGTVVEGIAFM